LLACFLDELFREFYQSFQSSHSSEYYCCDSWRCEYCSWVAVGDLLDLSLK